MANALVLGAATPAGRAVVAELSRQGLPVIAHVVAAREAQDGWKKRLRMRAVRVDFAPFDPMPMFELIHKSRPTHIIDLLPADDDRRLTLHRAGLAEGNYEYGSFKYTNIAIDAVVSAQYEARFVYIRSALATGSRKSTLAPMLKAEQKIQFSTLPYTLVHAPLIAEHAELGQPILHGLQMGMGVVWRALGLVGLKGLDQARRSVSPATLARSVVDMAFAAADKTQILGPERVRGGL